ncbi:MAG: RNA polymerase sigma-54 factor, partial [Treponema sp.]|nr:RNA polymerase sigma-54 factor [Treponema sp.]
KASELIVKRQHAFFEKGPGNLVPMKQEDLAKELGVHESTVSRLARSKYIQCSWGLFEVGYFFVSEVARKENGATKDSGETQEGEAFTKDRIIGMIEGILSEHAGDGKKLSDQKISEILSEKGVSISRRTVAKYRSQMNIASSYER